MSYRNRNTFKPGYHKISQAQDDLWFEGKQVVITLHAVARARSREIAFPDQVYDTIKSGKIKRFGHSLLNFIKKSQSGSIICIGEDTGSTIIIKTVERGN
jgi:hypothetical protein